MGSSTPEFATPSGKEPAVDISEHLQTSSIDEEVEPFLAETAELVQKRRSQARIIFDRFMRNRTAVGGAAFPLLLFLFCFVGPFLWRVNPNTVNVLSVSETLANPGRAPPSAPMTWVATSLPAPCLAARFL